ncbi:MAG: DNA primase [Acutalibacteraceae bacterium]
MAIPNEFINEVKARNDITDVIGGYVNLKRNGRTSKGLCPFHSEKTPSFTVFGDTSSFYCFGCQAGGDVIGFIRRIENLDYVEAVKFLANRAGMQMVEENKNDGLSKMRLKIREQNREAGRFFYRALYSPEGGQALDYFHSRGLSDETIRHFGLGWSPDSWDALTRHLANLGYRQEEILAADLGYRSRNGGVIDRFRNRVMFPIIDLQGSVIGFGGRNFTEDARGGKYVNTSDTLIYKKTNNLFAMNFAKNSKSNELILCEGYMDVIALHQAGFTNAVAALGTAVTPQQAQLMAKYTDKVVLSQDGDEAGQKSINRSIPIMKDAGLSVRVLEIRGAKDPDEFIKKYGPERFKNLLDGCANDIEYSIMRIKNKYDIATDDGRLHYLQEVCGFLSGLSPLEREVYAVRVADGLKIEKSVVLSQAETQARRKKYEEKRREFRDMAQSTAGIGDKVNPERSKNLKGAIAEEALLCLLFSHQDMIAQAAAAIKPGEFVTDFSRRVYEQFVKLAQDGQEVTVSLLAQQFSESETAEIVRIINSGETKGTAEFGRLIDVIKEESSRTKPQDAAHLSPEELLEQMKKLKQKKS